MRAFSSQVRAARALLGWSQTQFAAACGLPLATLHRLEIGQTKPRRATVEAIRRGLEAAGVVLIEPDGAGSWGVRFALLHPDRTRENAGEA